MTHSRLSLDKLLATLDRMLLPLMAPEVAVEAVAAVAATEVHRRTAAHLSRSAVVAAAVVWLFDG